MTNVMFKNCSNLLEKCCLVQLSLGKRTIKRNLPIDPAIADELPVHRYPKKNPKDNTIYVWGLGEHGALGHYLQKKKLMRGRDDMRFRTYNRPLRLHFGEHNNVTNVAAGFGFSLFSVKTKGPHKVYGCGINSDSQLGYQAQRRNAPMGLLIAPAPIMIPFENVRKTVVTGVAAGRAHSVVVTNKGQAFTFGHNAYGQCGRTIHPDEKFCDSSVVHLIKNLEGFKIASAECGQDHTLFLTENGMVYSCGWGADGQTGLGHHLNEGKPSRVLGDIKGENIVKVSSKCDCVLALNDKGQVFGWGNSEYGQLFDEGCDFQQVNRPIHVKKCDGFGKIVDIAAAGSFCMMLNEAGEVFTWGFGILGRGPEASHSWKPEIIPPILFGRNQFAPDVTVKLIYCGLNHSAAVNNKGDIFTWGKNKGACLGLGDRKDQFFPLRVCLSALCKKMSLGVDHTLAICGSF